MEITPDAFIFWQHGIFKLNATIVVTWAIMALLVIASWLVTRKLSPAAEMSRWQNLLETVVELLRREIREASQQEAEQYLPLIGTLFLFIVTANILTIFPGYWPPTGSLSTTAALALCVLVAVPVYGIASQGLVGYLTQYVRPTPIMLPFNIIGEFSRTLALAVRLFGNIMSGTMIIAVLLAVTPFFFPVIMHVLGLLTGVIQAYIFAILAIVYIASATRTHQIAEEKNKEEQAHG
ncbi:MAG: F0F1 ATP synthase subunit A [Deltaproteobacteria bacterium]|jgi:F-type H+-transporting ATPase subunit a